MSGSQAVEVVAVEVPATEIQCDHPGTGFEPVGGITIVGGHVHRGSDGQLEGQYIFGDFAQQFVVPSGRLYHFDPASDDGIQQFVLPGNAEYGLFLKGFGRDEDGNSYVCGSTALAPFGDTGVVHRMRSVGGRKFRMDLDGDQEVPPVDSESS